MKKFLLAALAAAALSAAPQIVSAAPILGCPAGEDCNGVSLGAEIISLGGTQYRIDVVFDFAGYDSNQTDLLQSVGIKDFTSGDVTAPSFALTAGTLSGGSFALTTNELTANGCAGGSGGTRLCVQASGNNGVVLHDGANFQTATYSFTFNTDGTIGTFVHLKFQYIDPLDIDNKGDATKVGSLGSFNLPFSVCDEGNDPNCDGVPDTIPEPTSLALLGLGMISVGYARRRRQ